MGLFDDVLQSAGQGSTDAPTKITVRPGDKMGAGEAAARGAVSGASLNFDDELAGLYKASGIPDYLAKLPPTARRAIEAMPLAKLLPSIIGAGWLGVEALTGEGEATRNYEQGRDEVRAANKKAEEDQFGANLTGQLVGGLALPVGAVGQAATLPGRMAAGALTGAGVGALTGAGAGESTPDRMTQAGTGLALGGALGAVAPPLIEGAVRGGQALAAPMANAFRGAIRPGQEASRRAATSIVRDIQNDPNAATRLTPGEFGATPQASILDMGGETTRALARSAANTSPEGRAALSRTIDDRFEGQAGRLTSWLDSTFNYPNAQAQQQAIEQAARPINRAAYGRAMRDPNAQSMWDEGFQQLTAAPAVRDAIRQATTSGANRAAAEGFRPPVNPFQFAPDGTMTMRPGLTPSLQFWDQVKKNLDGMIGVARRQGNEALVGELQPLRTALVRHLDELVPSYQQARAGAAHFFGAENALEAGENFVGAGNRFGNRQARQALATMTPTERQLFQDGYVSRLVERLNADPDRRSVLNRIAQSPAAREEIELALGPQRARELEAVLRVEGIMDLARGAVQGNSTTARQLAEMGLAGGAGTLGAYGTYHMDPMQMTYAAVAGALLAGRRNVDQRVANRVAQLLVSRDPQQLMLGIRIAARNNRMLENLRSVDRRLSAAGAQQTPAIGAIQGPMRAAAENEQPQPEGAVYQ